MKNVWFAGWLGRQGKPKMHELTNFQVSSAERVHACMLICGGKDR